MSTINFSLEGKVALVTGGSRGIGRAIALAFAEAGAEVVISSRKLPDLEAVAEEIKAVGRKGVAVSSHIAKPEEAKNLVETVQKEFGRLDILVRHVNPVYVQHAGVPVDVARHRPGGQRNRVREERNGGVRFQVRLHPHDPRMNR